MSSPQSPADFLPAVRDKSPQLEEELTNHREVPAGGTTKHHRQPGPERGTHDTNIRDTNQKSESNTFMFHFHWFFHVLLFFSIFLYFV